MHSALITTAELARALQGDHPPVVLDASWHMPATGRSGAAEFAERHIPTARFFDIDAIRDSASPYPHMMPAEKHFAQALGALGVREVDEVVLYDSVGLFSAPRAWWMLRAMGHKGSVRILNGGLPAWHGPFDSGPASVAPATYHATFQPGLFAGWNDVVRADDARILDARSASRFAGAEPEPRPGLCAGHIPGSQNLHYAILVDAEGKLKAADALRGIFADADVMDMPVIASCGSGVTACILALGLHEIGRDDVRVYDGSWAEWGSRDDLPVATGTV